jgi:hypothetical protein
MISFYSLVYYYSEEFKAKVCELYSISLQPTTNIGGSSNALLHEIQLHPNELVFISNIGSQLERLLGS